MEREEVKAKKARFYANWKKIWRDPSLSVYGKAALYNIYLYRSDGEGWFISERKMAKDLGISKNTASKALDEIIQKEYVYTNNKGERVSRKLRLSGSLLNPARDSRKSKNRVTARPTKYKRKYKKNPFNVEDKEDRENEMILSSNEIRKRIERYKKGKQDG